MIVRWLEPTIRYDGAQLAAHWILRTTGIVGDALVAFRGPCGVAREQIADLADIDGPGIAGDDMLHFLWERFDDGDLERAVLRQRLLAVNAASALSARGVPIERDGDDLFVGGSKLSISIATRSLVSSLIHFAMNVTTRGTPVRTTALDELGIEVQPLAEDILSRVAVEEASIGLARAKVRGRGEA